MSADPASSDVPGLKNNPVRPKPKPTAAAGRRSPENAASLDNTSLPANQPYYGAEYGIGLRPDVLKQSQKIHILYSEYSCQQVTQPLMMVREC